MINKQYNPGLLSIFTIDDKARLYWNIQLIYRKKCCSKNSFKKGYKVSINFTDKTWKLHIYWAITNYFELSSDVYVYICLFNYPSIHLSIHLYMSVYLSIYICLSLYIYLSIHPSIYISVYLSTYLSFFLTIYSRLTHRQNMKVTYLLRHYKLFRALFRCLCIHICLSNYPSIHLCISGTGMGHVTNN